MRKAIVRGLASLIALSAVVIGAEAARADSALFTFGEMRKLQQLPREATRRTIGEDELVLYRNMEFYVYTVFESLLAANNAALVIHDEPLFCAPRGVFRFRTESDIADLAGYVTDELLALTEEVGGSSARYHDRPASEVILLALRAAFPCDEEAMTASILP